MSAKRGNYAGLLCKRGIDRITAAKKRGRRPLAIDATAVEGMARVGATNVEIAAFLGCSPDTIERRFKDVVASSRSCMRLRVRMMQWEAAMKGDSAMLIWLGKQYLNQKDVNRTEHTGADGKPIETQNQNFNRAVAYIPENNRDPAPEEPKTE